MDWAALRAQITHFGQTPAQLFTQAHRPRGQRRLQPALPLACVQAPSAQALAALMASRQAPSVRLSGVDTSEEGSALVATVEDGKCVLRSAAAAPDSLPVLEIDNAATSAIAWSAAFNLLLLGSTDGCVSSFTVSVSATGEPIVQPAVGLLPWWLGSGGVTALATNDHHALVVIGTSEGNVALGRLCAGCDDAGGSFPRRRLIRRWSAGAPVEQLITAQQGVGDTDSDTSALATREQVAVVTKARVVLYGLNGRELLSCAA